jgi:hypothetical protein
MSEILHTGNDYMNDDGDVLPINRPEWEPQEEFIPDHIMSDAPREATARDTLQTPERRGVSVSLEQRKLAITAIMEYFNQVNKRNGLSKSRHYTNFDDRYKGDSNRVASGMNSKADRLYRQRLLPALEQLSQSEQLKAAGFDPAEVDADRSALGQTISRQYGPGKAYVRDRKKVVDRVTDTYDVVVLGKTTRRYGARAEMED